MPFQLKMQLVLQGALYYNYDYHAYDEKTHIDMDTLKKKLFCKCSPCSTPQSSSCMAHLSRSLLSATVTVATVTIPFTSSSSSRHLLVGRRADTAIIITTTIPRRHRRRRDNSWSCIITPIIPILASLPSLVTTTLS